MSPLSISLPRIYIPQRVLDESVCCHEKFSVAGKTLFLSVSLRVFLEKISIWLSGNPLQYSCLENPMDGEAWWATVHGLQRVGHDWATSLSLSQVEWVGLPRWLSSKEFACQYRRCWFDPWVEKIPWKSKWQPTPVFLPGESHGQSVVGYSSGHKEWDKTDDWVHTHTHTQVDCVKETRIIQHIQGPKETKRRGSVSSLSLSLICAFHFLLPSDTEAPVFSLRAAAPTFQAGLQLPSGSTCVFMPLDSDETIPPAFLVLQPAEGNCGTS